MRAGISLARVLDCPGKALSLPFITKIMNNPLTQYPKPPFARQPQKPPGLASKMKPQPDHGEKSYEGTGRLTGRKALVTGGDSGIGRAAAIAYAREGADVAINYLPEEESDAAEVIKLIKAAGRKAIALPGDIREESFCVQLVADAVKALGGLDILVNNAGQQQAVDSILDLTTEQFDSTFRTNVYALFLDHESGNSPPKAWGDHHQHILGSGLRPIAEPGGLRADQELHRVLHQKPCPAAGREGNPGQRGRPWPVLDAVAGKRRTAAEEGAEIRRRDGHGPSRPARGTRARLRIARLE